MTASRLLVTVVLLVAALDGSRAARSDQRLQQRAMDLEPMPMHRTRTRVRQPVDVDAVAKAPIGDPEDFVSFLAQLDHEEPAGGSHSPLANLDMKQLMMMAHTKLTREGKIQAPPSGLPKGVENQAGGDAVQVFEIYDVNQSGTIGFDEFQQLLAVLGYHESEADTLAFFKSCDKDDSGDIAIGELEVRNGKSSFSLDKCLSSVDSAKATFLAASGDGGGDDLPRQMEEWCIALDKNSDQGAAAQAMAKAWKAACGIAREEAEKKAAAAAGGAADPFSAKTFCDALANGLDHHMQGSLWYHMSTVPTNYMPYTPPLATPGVKLKHLSNPRPCCDAHGQKGCHDHNIEQCVCEVDPHCCDNEWDLQCSEQVEKLRVLKGDTVLRCGRCPGQECLQKLASCADGNCDCTGGDESRHAIKDGHFQR